MQTLVTGATGLLGNNLVRTLVAQGHRVRAVVRSAEKARKLLADVPGVELRVGDVGNPDSFAEALEGVDVVFHTAAYFREYYGRGDHWSALERINVTGTLRLAELARLRGVRRFVDTSSSGVIGHNAEGGPGDENSPPGPLAENNLYVRSKAVLAPKLAELSARLGLETVQVLPGWMFGPGDAAPTPAGRMVLDYMAGRLPVIPPGGASIVDARDVAKSMIRAAEVGRPGERYILAGPMVTIAEVCRTLESITGLRAPRVQLSVSAMLAVAAISEFGAWVRGTDTLITREGVRTLTAHMSVSSAKAERELQHRARPLSETLLAVIDWYRKNGYVQSERQVAMAT